MEENGGKGWQVDKSENFHQIIFCVFVLKGYSRAGKSFLDEVAVPEIKLVKQDYQ